MPGRSIRFGLIGCGLMGRELASAAARWCHLTSLDVRPEFVAICDQNPETFRWFTDNFDSIGQTVEDYRELLANPDVEAVYCAVPHNLHREIYIAILESGKHLLGEKPFGIDREANAEIDCAIKAHPDLVVRCSSEFPFFPGVQRIVRAVREGRFGTLLEVECGFLHGSDLDPTKPINWKRRIETNGEYGCMGDLGLHVFHVPLRLGWKPRNVRAVLSNVMRIRKDRTGKEVPCETWDNATILCEAADGTGEKFPLLAKTQRIAPGETDTWYLSVKGTRFSARFSTKYPRTLETLPYEPGAPQTWHREDLGYASVYPAITGGIFEFGFPDAILQMFAAFCEQVEKGPDAELSFGCATHEEARATHEIFTAALKSQKEGSTVSVRL